MIKITIEAIGMWNEKNRFTNKEIVIKNLEQIKTIMKKIGYKEKVDKKKDLVNEQTIILYK